jgi:hypothetical protein
VGAKVPLLIFCICQDFHIVRIRGPAIETGRFGAP